jgi:CTP-dependent riboflavin kinase
MIRHPDCLFGDLTARDLGARGEVEGRIAGAGECFSCSLVEFVDEISVIAGRLNGEMEKRATIRGIVCEGEGEARGFTQLDWVRAQFRHKLGFDPYPGTLNLQIENAGALARWRMQPGISIEPSPGYCAAKCFRVQLNGQVSAAWIIPTVPGYPEDIVELMAPVLLREALNLRNGDTVSIQVLEGAVGNCPFV